MNDKLRRLLSDTLGVPPDAIKSDAAMNNTVEWDSIMHLNLCLSIEQAFGIRLTPEEILEMTSVPAIEVVLARHQVA
jgi:acyl carrier protein